MAWGSYYRNVICIARSVGVRGNWVICYLKGCNMSRLCLDEYFSLFFLFCFIAISTESVNYVCHKKITVENATVNW